MHESTKAVPKELGPSLRLSFRAPHKVPRDVFSWQVLARLCDKVCGCACLIASLVLLADDGCMKLLTFLFAWSAMPGLLDTSAILLGSHMGELSAHVLEVSGAFSGD